MKSNVLLEIPTLELLRLWEELVLARKKCNPYGGTVAEIYAYRLCPNRPSEFVSAKTRTEQAQQAADALVELCLFRKEHACVIRIGGLGIKKWRKVVGATFDHRVFVEVIRK